jgi:hypothetical protein
MARFCQNPRITLSKFGKNPALCKSQANSGLDFLSIICLVLFGRKTLFYGKWEPCYGQMTAIALWWSFGSKYTAYRVYYISICVDRIFSLNFFWFSMKLRENLALFSLHFSSLPSIFVVLKTFCIYLNMIKSLPARKENLIDVVESTIWR